MSAQRGDQLGEFTITGDLAEAALGFEHAVGSPSQDLNIEPLLNFHSETVIAAAGEVLRSETVYAKVAERFPSLERRTLTLRGKEAPMDVRVLRDGERH